MNIHNSAHAVSRTRLRASAAALFVIAVVLLFLGATVKSVQMAALVAGFAIFCVAIILSNRASNVRRSLNGPSRIDINPQTGMPMRGGVDASGVPFGGRRNY